MKSAPTILRSITETLSKSFQRFCFRFNSGCLPKERFSGTKKTSNFASQSEPELEDHILSAADITRIELYNKMLKIINSREEAAERIFEHSEIHNAHRFQELRGKLSQLLSIDLSKLSNESGAQRDLQEKVLRDKILSKITDITRSIERIIRIEIEPSVDDSFDEENFEESLQFSDCESETMEVRYRALLIHKRLELEKIRRMSLANVGVREKISILNERGVGISRPRF